MSFETSNDKYIRALIVKHKQLLANERERTSLLLSNRVPIQCPSHTLIRLSFPRLASNFPSGLKASAHISSVCPFSSSVGSALAFPFPFSCFAGRTLKNVCDFLPVCRSHLTMVPSLLDVNSQRASSDATAAVAENLCPRVRRVGVFERPYYK